MSTNLSEKPDGTESTIGDGGYFEINPNTLKISDYEQNMTMGELIYRLHFLAPLNFWGISGYILAGLITFFFLIVLITGLYIHWDKMISFFYVFRPNAKWKIIWTDSHVTLGFISLPFQLIYAITGGTLIIGYMLFIEPPLNYVKNGKTEEYFENVNSLRSSKINLTPTNEKLTTPYSINHLMKKAHQKFPSVEWNDLTLQNINDKNMTLEIKGFVPQEDKIMANVLVKFKVENGQILEIIPPDTKHSIYNYINDIPRSLHYGDFGGYPLKVIYILLGFISCYVIISGVMIWHTARDKKNIKPLKRKINYNLTQLYLAISLGMIPITALSLIGSKINILYLHYSNNDFIYSVFFYGWAILIILLMILKNFKQVAQLTLSLTALFAISIPIVGGITNKRWIWQTLNSREIQLFTFDLLWLSIGLIAFYSLFKINKKQKIK